MATTTQPAYNVTDEAALYAAHPKFFKLDHSKVKKAVALELELPGVEVEVAKVAAPVAVKRTARKNKAA